ncbi:MAG: hypothetical protein J7M29_08320 [Verrucomicrobia bacterium]|nr:hypothetical protein [Verrucomicrobiota bacterium]
MTHALFPPRRRQALATAAICLAVAFSLRAADLRRFSNGYEIPSEGYCDQPYIVVLPNGNWLCTLTTGKGREGQRGQHVVAAISKDQGRTWSKLINIEPADGPEASWVVPLLTPWGRIYAFYDYNGDNVGHGNPAFRHPSRGAVYRADMLGWYCYRYSDDGGRAWSAKRYRLPMPLAECDRRNDWRGRIQIFWGIDKPKREGGAAFFAFTRLGRYILDEGEGWLYRSDNILSERNPERIRWTLLPEGGRGIRNEAFGSVQEEHNLVPLGHNRLYCVYRTTMGFPCHAYSENGGRAWSKPEPMTYTPGGRVVRHPRACPKVWRTREGRYLFWFHNNGEKSYNVGRLYGSRNIAWLSAGRLVNGLLHWSQPEIVRYCANPLRGCSYPDLVEDGGRFFISATQKSEARVAPIDPQLLRDLWRQHELRQTAREGLALDRSPKAESGARSWEAPMPRLPNLAQGGGFTVELWLRLPDATPGRVLLDSRSRSGGGLVAATGERNTVWLDMFDGRRRAGWDSDPHLVTPNRLHHVVFIVDGGPKVILAVVDGRLCDRGRDDCRPYGYGRFVQSRYLSRFSENRLGTPELGNVGGGPALRMAPWVQRIRIYNRPLRVSEAVGNFRAGP